MVDTVTAIKLNGNICGVCVCGINTVILAISDMCRLEENIVWNTKNSF